MLSALLCNFKTTGKIITHPTFSGFLYQRILNSTFSFILGVVSVEGYLNFYHIASAYLLPPYVTDFFVIHSKDISV